MKFGEWTKIWIQSSSLFDAANVFGKPKTNTDFFPYTGEGFKILIPSKWNPSKEVEYPGQVLRYEDNFDATSNVTVMVQPTTKKSISEYGSPEDFLGQVTPPSLSARFFDLILGAVSGRRSTMDRSPCFGMSLSELLNDRHPRPKPSII